MISVFQFMSLKKYVQKDQNIIKKCQIPSIIITSPIASKKKTLVSSENSWAKSLSMDQGNNKIVISILNKLTESNYDKLVSEISGVPYKETKIVEILFNKAVAEPGFIHLYTRFCQDLDLNSLINDICVSQFKLKKHPNLIKFICSLNKIGIIKDLRVFIDVLLEDLSDTNIELLIVILKINGSNGYTDIVDILKGMVLKPRLKFMLMDVGSEPLIP
jgi:hypothetical protein